MHTRVPIVVDPSPAVSELNFTRMDRRTPGPGTAAHSLSAPSPEPGIVRDHGILAYYFVSKVCPLVSRMKLLAYSPCCVVALRGCPSPQLQWQTAVHRNES